VLGAAALAFLPATVGLYWCFAKAVATRQTAVSYSP
jgi:hypothetical protein